MLLLVTALSCAPQAGMAVHSAPPPQEDQMVPMSEELRTEVDAIKHQQEHISLQLEKIDMKMKDGKNGTTSE